MHPLLKHVLEEKCQDPDCEVHNIIVALEEGVVDDVSVAYFIAGMDAAASALETAADEAANGYREAARHGRTFQRP